MVRSMSLGMVKRLSKSKLAEVERSRRSLFGDELPVAKGDVLHVLQRHRKKPPAQRDGVAAVVSRVARERGLAHAAKRFAKAIIRLEEAMRQNEKISEAIIAAARARTQVLEAALRYGQ